MDCALLLPRHAVLLRAARAFNPASSEVAQAQTGGNSVPSKLSRVEIFSCVVLGFGVWPVSR